MMEIESNHGDGFGVVSVQKLEVSPLSDSFITRSLTNKSLTAI